MTARAAVPASIVAAALAGVILSACGVAPESTARSIDPPRGLYPTLTSPTPAVADAGTVPERLFFVKDGALVAVMRRVRTTPTIDILVRDLLNGPSDAELADGLTSALLGTNVIAEVRLVGGEAHVELAEGLEGTGRSDEVLAFAQVVCTLSTLPDVTSVSFIRDQQRIPVPRADGSLSEVPLTFADYAGLVANS
jgi:hypothetical protein